MRDYIEVGLIVLAVVLSFIAGMDAGDPAKLRTELEAKERLIKAQAAGLQMKDAVIAGQARRIHNLEGIVRDNNATIENLLGGERYGTPSRAGFTRLIMDSTAYTAVDWPDNPAYGFTRSGHQLTEADAWKIVAVDPRFWPFGTVFLVQDDRGNWHRAVACDTGADVRGPNRMDVFVSMEDRQRAWNYGRRQVPVAVLGRVEL